MKKTKKTLYKALSLIFILLSTGSTSFGASSLLTLTIQCAKNSIFNELTIYQYGKIVPTQKQESTFPKITCTIPKNSYQTRFYILITPVAPESELKKFPNQEEVQNTIDYLKISPGTPYTFYALDLVQDLDNEDPKATPTYHWDIQEDTLPETGQIPDTTIIINCLPTFIKAIKGGNNLELPTLYVDFSFSEQFGSEENFEDALIKLQLSSLDFNAIHAPTKHKIKSDGHRLLVMETLT
jgi:hypothetical protein